MHKTICDKMRYKAAYKTTTDSHKFTNNLMTIRLQHISITNPLQSQSMQKTRKDNLEHIWDSGYASNRSSTPSTQ